MVHYLAHSGDTHRSINAIHEGLCHHGASVVLGHLARKLNGDLTFTAFDSAICLEDGTSTGTLALIDIEVMLKSRPRPRPSVENPSLLYGSC
jgi:hypothetical protein